MDKSQSGNRTSQTDQSQATKNAIEQTDKPNNRTKDNRQVDSKMWSKVAGWHGDFRYFQGGTYEDGSPIDTCTEEGLAYVYDEESDRLQNKIDDLDQPLPNSLLIGLVGAGVLIIGVILYKVIK